MLAEQFRVWSGYPADLKAQIEIVLVDDGSPEPVVDEPRPAGLPILRIYRVLEDRPWHQHGARNLAATEATAPWLLLTDMDHVVPAESLAALLTRLNCDLVYTFGRVDAPNRRPKLLRGEPHPHQNTFACQRSRFWSAGGYDEDCLGYGTDGYFLRRLLGSHPPVHLPDVVVVRYPREVIADASTRGPEGVDPRAFRDAARRTGENVRLLSEKQATGRPPAVLNFPWERVL